MSNNAVKDWGEFGKLVSKADTTYTDSDIDKSCALAAKHYHRHDCYIAL